MCSKRQAEILENAAVCLKNGGYIVYATCTFSIEENEKTVAKISSDKIKKNLAAFAAGGDERTISIFSSKGHFVPVVGWLVCTDGVEKGRDYRLVSGRNFIGRAYQMDVSIPDDKGISRENHCSVVYDPKTKKFCLVPGENVVFYNGEKISLYKDDLGK